MLELLAGVAMPSFHVGAGSQTQVFMLAQKDVAVQALFLLLETGMHQVVQVGLGRTL